MTGTILNVAGIVAGGATGLLKRKPLSLRHQALFKIGLGLFTVFCGLRLTWISLNGTFLQILKQLAIVLVSMTLGKLTGRLLRLQKTSNRLGQFARTKMLAAKRDNPRRFNDGFTVCAALFCAAPLGILGAISEGLPAGGNPLDAQAVIGGVAIGIQSWTQALLGPLSVKALMDGLAAMSFTGMFGAGVMFSAVPVLVFQGSITLLCARTLHPFLQAHGLIDSVNATAGLLVFCVALLIFEIRKIEVTDYLPSLCFAPLLTYWLR